MAEGSGSRFGQASMSMRNGTPRDKAVYANSRSPKAKESPAEPPKKRKCAAPECKNFLGAWRPKKDKYCAACVAQLTKAHVHELGGVKEVPPRKGANSIRPITGRFQLLPPESPTVPPKQALA